MSKTWKHDITRCQARKPDGKRCKVDDVKPGHRFCEHHDTDIVALFRTPEKCIEIMTGRYPKRHHPAILSDIIQLAIEKELTIATAIPTVEAHK